MEIPAEVVALVMALREAGPHVIRWVSGRQAARDASVTARAAAAEIDARADASVVAAWRELAAQHDADREADRAEFTARLDAEREARQRETENLRRSERECLERYDDLRARHEEMVEARLREAADARRTRALVDEMARRLGVVARTTPSRAHDTVLSGELAPLDPTAPTPPAGHRLTPPSAPAGAGLGPESLTPGSGFEDDTPR